jgi:hypothetical protein
VGGDQEETGSLLIFEMICKKYLKRKNGQNQGVQPGMLQAIEL